MVRQALQISIAPGPRETGKNARQVTNFGLVPSDAKPITIARLAALHRPIALEDQRVAGPIEKIRQDYWTT